MKRRRRTGPVVDACGQMKSSRRVTADSFHFSSKSRSRREHTSVAVLKLTHSRACAAQHERHVAALEAAIGPPRQRKRRGGSFRYL